MYIIGLSYTCLLICVQHLLVILSFASSLILLIILPHHLALVLTLTFFSIFQLSLKGNVIKSGNSINIG